MTTLFFTFFSYFANFIEACLFFYLIKHALGFHKPYKKKVFLGVLCSTFLVSLFNILHVNPIISMILLLILHISLTLYLTEGTLTSKILWGSSYMLIVTIVDKLIYLSFMVILKYAETELQIQGFVRFQMTCIYLIACTVCVYCLTHFAKRNYFLPPFFRILFVILMLLGIVASEAMISVIAAVKADPTPHTHLTILYFINVGFLCIFALIIFVLGRMGSIYQHNIELITKNTELQMEEKQFELFVSTTDNLREWKHDFKNHLCIIHNFISENKCEEATNYLEELQDTFSKTCFSFSTGNTVLDAVLSTKQLIMNQNNIKFSHSIFITSKIHISNLEFSALMANLIDNAVEACMNLDKSKTPYIMLQIKPHRGMLSIILENSSNGLYHYDKSGALITIKQEGDHGLGLKRIRTIVENSGGFFQLEPLPDKFKVTLLIPIDINQ